MNQDNNADKRTPRKRGRRCKSDGPAFSAEELDELLVHGESVVDEDGTERHRYPSYRDLGSRFQVAHSLIGRFAQKHNCLERRQEAQAHTEQRVEAKLKKLRTTRFSLDQEDLLRTVDRYLVAFEEQLLQGQVCADNPLYFTQMVHLRAFLAKDRAPQTEGAAGMPSLEELQGRYQQSLQRSRVNDR